MTLLFGSYLKGTIEAVQGRKHEEMENV